MHTTLLFLLGWAVVTRASSFVPRVGVALDGAAGRADRGGAVTNSQIFSFNGATGRGTIDSPTVTAKASVSAKITESPKITLKAQGTKTKKNTKSALPTIVAPDNNLGAAAPSTSAAEVAKPSTSAVEVAESSEVVVSSEAAESVATTAATAVTSAAAGATASAKTTQSGRGTRSAKRFRTKTAKTAKATKTNGAAQSTAPAANTNASSAAASSSAPTSAASSSASITTKAGAGGIPTANPTTPVPVSRAGGTLQPSAAAEANKRDATATRAFSNVEIRAPNGQCISVDPTAGDFRQNLIPVSLVDCSGSPNEKWDVITAGVHNKPGRIPATLIVSTLTQGCISFDGRRTAGDTVTLFSCGGRADGGGETNSGQQFPFIGQLSFAFAPVSEGSKTCILDGPNGRLISGPCPTDGAQLFSIFP